MRRPLTITAAVVLQWVAAILAVLTGVELMRAAFSLSPSDIAMQVEGSLVQQGIVDVPGTTVVVGVLVAAIVLLAVAFLRVVLAVYLWRGRAWARAAVAALAVVSMLAAVGQVAEGLWLRGLVTFVVDLVVLWLLFTPAATAYVKAARP